MSACPKPIRKDKAPRKPIRTRRPLGTVRKEAKAAGDLTIEQWTAIVCFYAVGGRGMVCAYCQTSNARRYVQEHVVPITRGGRHAASNVVVACWDCNDRKGTQTWEPKLRHPWMTA